MRVIEYLYECKFSPRAIPRPWEVRVWCKEPKLESLQKLLLNAMNNHKAVSDKEFQPMDLAKLIARQSYVSAVQVKSDPIASILIYPEWP